MTADTAAALDLLAALPDEAIAEIVAGLIRARPQALKLVRLEWSNALEVRHVSLSGLSWCGSARLCDDGSWRVDLPEGSLMPPLPGGATREWAEAYLLSAQPVPSAVALWRVRL